MKQSIFILITMLSLVSCQQRKPVDSIYYNAYIYQVDSGFHIADAIAIDSGRIIAVGKESDIRDRFSTSNWNDLEGKFVYPGFIDGHSHFLSYGLGLKNADLSGTKSMDEIVSRLTEHSKKHPSDWILGRGWDQNNWKEKEFPDKSILDRTFPDKPVCLERIDGHALFVSSKVLQLAGITSKTKIDGGSILHDKKGEPTGVLIDNAMSLVTFVFPKDNSETLISALKEAEKECFAVGLTMVTDAGLDAGEIELIDRLQHSDSLKIRVYAMLNPNDVNVEKYMKTGIVNTGRLIVRSVKMYADGALGSRGAHMIDAYSDDPGNMGLQVNTTEFYEKYCSLALQYGYQANTHCIGDAANRMILNLYAKYLKGKNDKRWRIEHAQVIQPDDFHLFADYSVIPSVQTTHATSDMRWAGERLGPERIKYAYAYATLLKQNGWLVNGTDFPVEKINPVYSFYAAVSRKDLNGWPENGFQKENALTREQALRSITIWAAKGCFMEKFTGSLEKGKLADFTVCDQDLMKAEESKIPLTKVLMTVIEGEEMFK
jgi:predicted amidohydrolase YtcJ